MLHLQHSVQQLHIPRTELSEYFTVYSAVTFTNQLPIRDANIQEKENANRLCKHDAPGWQNVCGRGSSFLIGLFALHPDLNEIFRVVCKISKHMKLKYNFKNIQQYKQ